MATGWLSRLIWKVLKVSDFSIAVLVFIIKFTLGLDIFKSYPQLILLDGGW
jgi:hypothetical protein